MISQGAASVSKDIAALDDILAAIAAIEEATQGDQNAFIQSAVIQDASLYRLVVIGEAVARLSADSRESVGVDEILGDKRGAMLDLARKYGAYNVRVFGSVARGQARMESDVDLLVD